MNSLFGDSPLFVQEAKLLNIETTYLSTIISGFNAVRTVTGHLNSYLVHKSTDAADIQVATLGKLHLLLLQAQSFSVQSGVFVFKENLSQNSPSVTLIAEKGLNFATKLKAVFDRAVSISTDLDKIKSTNKKDSGRKQDKFNSFLYEDEMNEENALESSRLEELRRIISGYEGTTEELLSILRPSSGQRFGDAMLANSFDIFDATTANVITGALPPTAAQAASEESKSTTPAVSFKPLNPTVQVETIFIAMNTICDVGLYQPVKDPNQSNGAKASETITVASKMATPTKNEVKESAAEEMKSESEAIEKAEGEKETMENAEGEESKGETEGAKVETAIEGEALEGIADPVPEIKVPEGIEGVGAEEMKSEVPNLSPPAVTTTDEAAVDWEKEALLFRFFDYFKSIKLEVKAALLNVKANSDHFVSALTDLKESFKQLLSCFREEKTKLRVVDFIALSAEKQEEVQQLLKAVLQTIRKVNHPASPSGQQSLCNPDVLKYFPTSLMTQIVSTTGAVGSDVQEEMQLRDFFSSHVEKYWDIM